jgi:hypothetical protein
MQPNARVAARRRPSRLQVALAAAWLIASLAIGSAVSAEPGPEGATTQTISTATQP